MRLEIIMNRLRNIPGENLLVIDNVSDEIETFTRKLPPRPDWKILLTSRDKMTDFIELPLDTLPEAEALELFYLHYKLSRDDDNLKDILASIGYHTLTTEFLAKTAYESGWTIEELKRKLSEGGLEILDASQIRIDHYPQSERIDPFEYLNKIFKIANLEEEAQTILRYFSILPSIDIDFVTLQEIFDISEEDEGKFQKKLTALWKKGWLTLAEENAPRAERRYRAHQIIQQVSVRQLHPNPENCDTIIKSLTGLLSHDSGSGENPLDKVKYIPYAEEVLRIFPQKTEIFATLANNLSLRFSDNGDYKLALEYGLKALSIFEKVLPPNHPDLATSYFTLASIYYYLQEYRKAEEYIAKAIAIFQKSLPPEHPHIKKAFEWQKAIAEASGRESQG